MYLELCTENQLCDFLAEFGATKESFRQDVHNLMQWIEKQPHLPNIKDETWLANVLLRSKNSLEHAKKRLDYYFTNRAMYPEIFQNRDLKLMQKELNMFVFLPCPKLTPDGHRVIISTVLEHNKEDLPTGKSIIRGMQLIFDFCLKVDQVRGVTLVYDTKNVSMALVTVLLSTLNEYLLIQNKINPIRYNKVYILNLPSYAQPLLNFFCIFLKKEIHKLVIWKRPPSTLCEVIPKTCLPEEYGGTEKSIRKLRNEFYDMVEDFKVWFEEQDKLIADLTKKSRSTSTDRLSYGLEGSFRKLCVD